jgi:isoleucyl-tRNA synthetase
LLGNLSDFDPKLDFCDANFEEIDRWALARLAEVSQTVEAAYDNFEFHVVYRTLYNFCTLDLSSFYFDVLKDRLYILAPDSKSRKAAQSALFVIADSLVRLLAPILPFTSEEVWGHLFPEEEQGPSVHLSEFRGDAHSYQDTKLLKRWELLLQIREKVTKALEESRQARDIGNSLEAKVLIRAHPEVVNYLSTFLEPRFIFLVSGFGLEEDSSYDREDVRVGVQMAEGEKCQRCWNYRLSVGSHSDLPVVCSRCYEVLGQIREENN